MKVLLIHQNFPGQYNHLGLTLVRRCDQGFALLPKVKERMNWHGFDVLSYKIKGQSSKDIDPWLVDLEAKVLRAENCYSAAIDLRHKGLVSDVILAHHVLGILMFLKDVWPEAKVAIYCEFYYSPTLASINFDPEFPIHHLQKEPLRTRLWNLKNVLQFDIASAGISPTQFSADTFPQPFRDKISVLHDGIDTAFVHPNPQVKLQISKI